MTLGRSARSQALLAYGTSRLVTKTKRLERIRFVAARRRRRGVVRRLGRFIRPRFEFRNPRRHGDAIRSGPQATQGEQLPGFLSRVTHGAIDNGERRHTNRKLLIAMLLICADPPRPSDARAPRRAASPPPRPPAPTDDARPSARPRSAHPPQTSLAGDARRPILSSLMAYPSLPENGDTLIARTHRLHLAPSPTFGYTPRGISDRPVHGHRQIIQRGSTQGVDLIAKKSCKRMNASNVSVH
jgi:hypothetical protein